MTYWTETGDCLPPDPLNCTTEPHTTQTYCTCTINSTNMYNIYYTRCRHVYTLTFGKCVSFMFMTRQAAHYWKWEMWAAQTHTQPASLLDPMCMHCVCLWEHNILLWYHSAGHNFPCREALSSLSVLHSPTTSHASTCTYTCITQDHPLDTGICIL